MLNRMSRLLLIIGCFILIAVSWVGVLGAKSNKQKQTELVERALEYTKDEIYVFAIPLLEEAAGYKTRQTYNVESKLKEAYLEMAHQREYLNSYTDLLEKQMARKDATAETFLEVAKFYLGNSKIKDALGILKDGINKTGSEELINLYESNRYIYSIGNNRYENVTAIHGKTITVQNDGFWGLALANGTLIIPCEYDKISTYSGDRVIVQKNDTIYAVNSDNNRVALLKTKILDFGNFADNRIPLLTSEGWVRASGEFVLGSAVFENIGTYSEGYAAAKQSGKWGVVNLSSEWLLPPEYDEIKMDELGRAHGRGAMFAGKGNSVNLFVKGKQVSGPYEDAKPFVNSTYAAVKKNGKWGFIDISGEVKIDYQFDDALSFGQHLAAVKQGDLWGYISLNGDIVIEPIFLQAGSFVNGSAPVLTELGWQFITLVEYTKGASL